MLEGCGRSLSQHHQHPQSLRSPRPPLDPATGTASAPGAGTARTEPHLMRSCFSVARFCELGVYWSKSHSAASEAGEEIKIWAVLASSQTSGCTHRCLGLRLRSPPAWPPAPTCATERGEEGGQMGNIFIRASQHSSGSRTQPRGRCFTADQSFSLLSSVPHLRQTALGGAVGSPPWNFTAPSCLAPDKSLLSSAEQLVPPHQGGPFSEGSFIPGVTPSTFSHSYYGSSVQPHGSRTSLTGTSLARPAQLTGSPNPPGTRCSPCPSRAQQPWRDGMGQAAHPHPGSSRIPGQRAPKLPIPVQ